MMSVSTIFALISSAIIVATAQERNLTYVVTNTRLPGRNFIEHSALYDGEDSIYIVGGSADFLIRKEVLKYSIESGKLESVGKFPEVYGGGAVLNGNYIYYIGGYNYTTPTDTIYRFCVTTGNNELMYHLPVSMADFALAFEQSRQFVYTFGGYSHPSVLLDSILQYDILNNRVTEVARFPEARNGGTAVWDYQRQVSYIFGGGVGSSDEIWKYDPVSRNASRFPASLPDSFGGNDAVAVIADQVYIIGGTRTSFGTPMTFDPSTGDSGRVPVSAWPMILQRAASVYVPKVDRFYIFGGSGYVLGDEIAMLGYDLQIPEG